MGRFGICQGDAAGYLWDQDEGTVVGGSCLGGFGVSFVVQLKLKFLIIVFDTMELIIVEMKRCI